MKNRDPEQVRCCRIAKSVFLVLMVLVVVLLTCLLERPYIPTLSDEAGGSGSSGAAGAPPRINCPDGITALMPFPASSGQVVLTGGQSYILTQDINVTSITITNGATLVLADRNAAINLWTKYILIENQGSLIIGSETCPYLSPLNIVLWGLSTDTDNFILAMGQKFIGVTATGTLEIHGPWKLSWTFLTATLMPGSGNVIINLADDATSWKVGDSIVIASTDYDMTQAEEFTLLPCPTCTANQVMIQGPVSYMHTGTMSTMNDKIFDVRAEVGILSRNIKISGQMQPACTTFCFFSFDTFGGHIKALQNAKAVHVEGAELYNMGQQEFLAAYPMHFHRMFDASGFYAKQLSIHHSFSRCVAIHATQNVLVQDVVGYDALGHCFFMWDGNEMNNSLIHNLGLLTKPGTQIPSDRDAAFCVAFSANFSNYHTDPLADCGGVSTFFITHPYNFLENNAAGGSAEIGFFYVNYQQPIGFSVGTLPPYSSMRSPLGSFINNRAHSHSNADSGGAGLIMDLGVKTTQPSVSDPRDYQDLINIKPSYAPHINSSLLAPRSPANLLQFVAFKNNLAAQVRGGDIWIDGSSFSDNDIAVFMLSSGSLPYDAGSQQRLTNSLVVGQSANNSGWAARPSPAIGVQVYEGPILVDGVTFMNFTSSSLRQAYPISFNQNTSHMYSSKNTIGLCTFVQATSTVYFGDTTSGYFGSNNMDGDVNQFLRDGSGSVTGVQGAVLIRNDSILKTPTCQMTQDGNNITYCTGASYGQLFVNASTKVANLTVIDPSTSISMVLTGMDKTDTTVPNTTQYQPTLRANTRYRLNWVGAVAPSVTDLSIYNFNQYEYLLLDICYPPGTTFTLAGRIWNQPTNTIVSTSSLTMSTDYNSFSALSASGYYWNATSNLLTVKMFTSWQTLNADYCPSVGCSFVTVVANITATQPYNC